MLTLNKSPDDRRKEMYAFTYPSQFDSMIRRGWLGIKQGDAFNTEQRWQNSDIAGANEAESKIEVGVWTDLLNVKRDHEVHPVLIQKWGRSRELNGSGTEWFSLPIPSNLIKNFKKSSDRSEILNYARTQLEEVFATFNKDNLRRSVQLRSYQQSYLDRILKDIKDKGEQIEILAELPPRWGKTTGNLSLFNSLADRDFKVMILPAYVLSVLTSFRNTIDRYRDYSDICFVDTVTEPNCPDRITQALKNNQRVVIGVSLHDSDLSRWKRKHKWLSLMNHKSFALLDEADYGSHTDNQRDKIEYLLANKPILKIVTSGTNAQRMSRGVSTSVADYISVPYVVLEESKEPGIVPRKMYQVFVGNRVMARAEELNDMDAPAWSKILEKSHAQQSFLETFFQSVYGYLPQYGIDLNDITETNIMTSMIFVNCNKAAMGRVAAIIRQACPEHAVEILNGDYTTGRDAEDDIREALMNIRNRYSDETKLIILAREMGSRSFSVGDIQSTIFLLDGGSLDGFGQKSSRCLTPPDDALLIKDKPYGHIISFSLDRNRTQENIQLQLLREAFQLSNLEKDANATTTMPQALTRVLNSVSLRSIGYLDELDVQTIDAPSMLAEYQDNEKVLAIAGVITNYEGILANTELYDLLFTLGGNGFGTARDAKKFKEILKKGRTKLIERTNINKPTVEERTAINRVREAINAVISSSNTVASQCDYKGNSFQSCLELIAVDPEVDQDFKEIYGIGAVDVLKFIPYLPVEFLDIAVHNTTQ